MSKNQRLIAPKARTLSLKSNHLDTAISRSRSSPLSLSAIEAVVASDFGRRDARDSCQIWGAGDVVLC